MAKDLPYFKFFCSEWNDGDITLESYEAQGLFINICSYYWSNECDVDFDKLLKKFRGYDEIINDLNAEGLLKINEDRTVCISFLDEQKEEREQTRKIKSKGGRASAEARRLKKLQQGANKEPTENEHVLNSCSTETQLLREEKIREEEIRKEKIKEDEKLLINNSKFLKECLTSSQWIDVVAMNNKTGVDVVKLYLKNFDSHLIAMDEQKKNAKEFKTHFVHWLNKQDLSQHRTKPIGRSNQVNYGN